MKEFPKSPKFVYYTIWFCPYLQIILGCAILIKSIKNQANIKGLNTMLFIPKPSTNHL